MTPLLSSALLRVQSDERLVQLAVQGHERAFEAIVDRYRRPLLRYLQRLLPGDRAEDVLQSALVSAWTSLDRGTAVRDLRPWLYRICHNGALNALARRGYDHDALSEALHGAASPLEQLEHRHVVRETLAALTGLPDRQRDALLAVAVEGRPHAEVARELGLSDGALRQLVHRARCTVRSAATAVTPVPVLNWFLQLGVRGGTPPIAELVGGAGVAGVAKVAAVLVATGAVLVGSHVTGHHAGAAQAAAAAPRVLRSGPGTRVAARQPVRRAPKAHGRHRTAHPRQSIARTGPPGNGSVVPPRVGTHREPPAPASKITVTHGDGVATGPEPTPAATTPAPTTTATTVSSAPEAAPEPAPPTPTEPPPAPAPEPCHEVACRPAPPPPPPPSPPPPTEPLPKIHAIRA